jgi:hypothetical protein
VEEVDALIIHHRRRSPLVNRAKISRSSAGQGRVATSATSVPSPWSSLQPEKTPYLWPTRFALSSLPGNSGSGPLTKTAVNVSIRSAPTKQDFRVKDQPRYSGQAWDASFARRLSPPPASTESGALFRGPALGWIRFSTPPSSNQKRGEFE